MKPAPLGPLARLEPYSTLHSIAIPECCKPGILDNGSTMAAMHNSPIEMIRMGQKHGDNRPWHFVVVVADITDLANKHAVGEKIQ